MNESKSLAKITVFWRVRLQNATWPYFRACKFTSDNSSAWGKLCETSNLTAFKKEEDCIVALNHKITKTWS